MNEGDTIVCIADPPDYPNQIRVGHKYIILDANRWETNVRVPGMNYNDWYTIINDDNKKANFDSKYFVSIQEWRNKQIDSIMLHKNEHNEETEMY
jgi:hypothetical protein